jgi:UDPglucose 6-dehydrogenase
VTRLAIVGAGYVGLVTGVCLADVGIEVICVDVDPARVAGIAHGRAPFHEPGLDELLGRVAGHGLSATTDLTEAMTGTDVVMLAVGTPSRDGAIDLTQIREAARLVGGLLDVAAPYPVVVIKSTVVPGTTRDVVTPILEAASERVAGEGFGVGVNPEFLTEGTAVLDFASPDRIVVGADDARSGDVIAGLYGAFPGVPVIRVNTATAEMIKYASNAMLATAISFANEIANLGSEIGGVDVVEVMQGVHLSRYLTTRAGDGTSITASLSSFLEAGCGYGGSCLPKDVAALAARGREVGSRLLLLEAVAQVNDRQPDRLVELVRRGLGTLVGRRVTVLGLAFKPDTDDVRSSPAFPVLRSLRAAGAEVSVHDPLVGPEALDGFGDVTYVEDLTDAVKQAEAVIIVTRWDDYRRVPELVGQLDPPPLVVDGRRMLDRGSVPSYTGIGL